MVLFPKAKWSGGRKLGYCVPLLHCNWGFEKVLLIIFVLTGMQDVPGMTHRVSLLVILCSNSGAKKQ